MRVIEKLRRQMPEEIDCFLISSDVSRKFLLNFESSAGVLLILRLRAVFFVDFRYYEMAKNSLKEIEVFKQENLINDVRKILIEEHCKTIAIEAERTKISEFFHLEKKFPEFKIVADGKLDELINFARAVKTEDEILKIKQALSITEEIFLEIINHIKIGTKEIELEREINSLIAKKSDGIAFKTIVVSGKNSAKPHGIATERKFEKGDLITLDFGCKVDGFCSDFTRTVSLGSIEDERKRKVCSSVLKALNLAKNEIKQGVEAGFVDSSVRNFFKKAGLNSNFCHALGHGVGFEIHEMPFLSEKSKTVLKENMILAVEPGLYFQDEFGVRVEDMVLVNCSGCETLNKTSNEIICL